MLVRAGSLPLPCFVGGSSSTVASGPASPASSPCAATVASGARCSCTPPPNSLAPYLPTPPRPSRKTSAPRLGERPAPRYRPDQLEPGDGRGSAGDDGPTIARPSPHANPLAARPRPVAHASGPGTPGSGGRRGSSGRLPLLAAQSRQRPGDLRLGPGPVVEPALADRTGPTPPGPAARPISCRSTSSERLDGPPPGGRGGLGHAPSVDACRFEGATRVDRLGLGPRRLGPPPGPMSTVRASRAVWKRSRPWTKGVGSSADRLALGQPVQARGDPLGGVGDGELQRLEGGQLARASWPPVRSAALWQKTAVRLAGSIPTRVGRPQKNLVEGQRQDLGRRRRRRAARGPGLAFLASS